MRVFLRGRPIVHHTPDDYDPESNAPSPSHQLDLNWVYGYRGKGKSKIPRGLCKKSVLLTKHILSFLTVPRMCHSDASNVRLNGVTSLWSVPPIFI